MTTFKQVMDELGDVQDRIDTAGGVFYAKTRKEETRVPSSFAMDLFRIMRQESERELRAMHDALYQDYMRAWVKHAESVEKTNASTLACLERIAEKLDPTADD